MPGRVGAGVSEENFARGEIPNHKCEERRQNGHVQCHEISVAKLVGKCGESSHDHDHDGAREAIETVDEVHRVREAGGDEDRDGDADGRDGEDRIEEWDACAVNVNIQDNDGEHGGQGGEREAQAGRGMRPKVFDEAN